VLEQVRTPAVVRAAAQVFVEDLAVPELATDDLHHLNRVLRLRPGETVVVADGRGAWRVCVFSGDPPFGTLHPEGEVQRTPRQDPEITVAFVPVKGDRPEWVVQKLTEVGVDRIVLLRSARSVVRWEADRAARQVERLSRVAREAAAQCRRAWLPEVHGVLTLGDLAAEFGGRGGVALGHPGGDPPSLDHPRVAIGPEGGWDEEELGLELPRVNLGSNILRAETAAVAVGSLLCGLREGLVSPSQA
jgi:16S rRNA (uracil1498-N3)-methyltransferase